MNLGCDVEIVTVYVALMEEDVDVWRPVDAKPVGPDRYRLVASQPDDETWEFKTGQIVKCEPRRLSDNIVRLVAVAACP